jgi:hypothetical protein
MATALPLLERVADFFTSPCPGKEFSETNEFLCPPVDPRYGPTMRPSFLRALERYIRLHRRMVDNTTDVKARHFLVIRNPLTHGMGNRFHTILSAFLMSIVTRRALLLDWQMVDAAHAKMHPNGVERMGMAALSELLQVPPFLDTWDLAEAKRRFPSVLADEKTYRSVNENHINCIDARGAKNASSVISITSWDYFGARLAVNKLHSAEVAEMISTDGPDAGVFAGLGRYLFRPSPGIEAALQRFLAQRTGPTVSAHFRIVGPNKIAAAHSGAFWECVRGGVLAVAEKHGVPATDVSVWFASDGTRAWDIAPSAICGPCKVAASQPDIRVACGECTGKNATTAAAPDPDSPTKNQNEKHKHKHNSSKSKSNATRVVINNGVPAARDSPEAVVAGVTDLFLLALADDHVVSARSTFSRSAAALSEHPPPLSFSHRGTCARRPESQSCTFIGVGAFPCADPLPPSWAAQATSCWSK